jgi:hypothetical protein
MTKLPKTKIAGYDTLKSFKIGGSMGISAEEKNSLLPYLAYILTTQKDPKFKPLYDALEIDSSKYQGQSIEEWSETIQNNKKDLDSVTKLASQLPDDA